MIFFQIFRQNKMASDHPEQSEQDNTETELQKIEELKIEVIII